MKYFTYNFSIWLIFFKNPSLISINACFGFVKKVFDQGQIPAVTISQVFKNLFTTDCHKCVRFREFEKNLCDFIKRAKQLMDDGKQKKHFFSKFQKVCSHPVLN